MIGWKISSPPTISAAARKPIIGQNITIALGTVIVMALLAVTRGIPLSLGVVAHEGSTVVVVLNSLRLLFVKAEWRRDLDSP